MSSIIQDHQRELCSEFTFKQTYARYLKDKKRRENWGEAVERMMSTHKAFYLPYMTNELKQDISDIEQAIKDKKILGSQRALQFGGDAILEKHWRIYNCTSSYCDRPRFFSESLWLLLCGSGVGFSIQKQHVSCLPAVIDMNQVLQAKYKTFVIEDSIEGWADALNVLVNFFFGLGEEYPQFSYSRIRKNGSALRHGGKAPGPFALKKALQRIEEVFLKRAGKQLKPIDCLDIVCHAADCVRSGGVRRAALLALFSMDDEEMLKSKTNTWFQTDGQRARANISIAVPRHSVTEDQFNAIMESTRQWGEPGFIFTDSLEFCFNPCVSGRTKILTGEGYKTAKELYESKKASTLKIDPRFGKGSDSQTTEKGLFLTGVQDVYKVQTKEGYYVECTREHRIMTSRGWVEAQNLVPGDQVHIYSNASTSIEIENQDDFNKGLIAGWWSGDGTIIDDKTTKLYMYNEKRECTSLFENITKCIAAHYEDKDSLTLPKEYLGIISKEDRKKIPAFVWNSSISCKRGYLQGVFSSDGSIQGSLDKKGVSIRLTQNDLSFLQDVQAMLLEVGIFSTIYQNRRPAQKTVLPDGRGGKKEYDTKAVHELIVSKENINTFHKLIGFCLSSKQAHVEYVVSNRKRNANKEKFLATFDRMDFVAKEEVFDLTEELTHSFVANGVVVHNCVEISMCPILVTKDGEVCKEYSLDLLDRSNRSKYEAMGYKFESGWQACNLTEVNASQFKDFEPQTIKEMFTCVRLATKLGTMQAGYTESTYLGDVSKKILEREALLGVSLTGLANSIFFKAHKEQKDLVESTLSDLAKHACLINRTFAPTIGVNAASRITCVKPSGTASLVLGCASGVHLEHAQKYIRRNQVDASSPIVQAYKKALPEAVELSAWSPTKTDEVVSFAIECDSVSLFKEDASAIDFLNLVKMIQTTWVKYGTSRPTSVEKAVHNVSNTTTVKVTEWGEVSKYLYENQGTFCGLSFLSATGDYDYIQAPFQRVYELDQINEVYNVAKTQIEREYKEAQRQIKSAYNDERLAKLKEVTSLLEEAGKRIEDKEALEAECEMIDAVYQDFIKHNLEMQKNDLGDAEHDYLESMKSVHADWEAKYSMYTLWQKLHSKRLKFDFDSIIEDHDETEGIQEVACAGGACLI